VASPYSTRNGTLVACSVQMPLFHVQSWQAVVARPAGESLPGHVYVSVVEVRRRVAHHPNTPPSTLKRLASSRDVKVRSMLPVTHTAHQRLLTDLVQKAGDVA